MIRQMLTFDEDIGSALRKATSTRLFLHASDAVSSYAIRKEYKNLSVKTV